MGSWRALEALCGPAGGSRDKGVAMARTVATQLVLASYDLRLDVAELFRKVGQLFAEGGAALARTRDERALQDIAAHVEVGLLLRRALLATDLCGSVLARLRELSRRTVHESQRLAASDVDGFARELLVGSWILLDVFDTGAQRHLVGMQLDYPIPACLRVTGREAAALGLASRGMANKAIAAELEVELGTAGALVSAGTRKLAAWTPRGPQMPQLALRRDGAAAFALELGGKRCLIGTAPLDVEWVRWGLTAEEVAVVELALGGSSNASIARTREKSSSTVQNQLASAFQKLGVQSRRELRWLWATTRAPRETCHNTLRAGSKYASP